MISKPWVFSEQSPASLLLTRKFRAQRSEWLWLSLVLAGSLSVVWDTRERHSYLLSSQKVLSGRLTSQEHSVGTSSHSYRNFLGNRDYLRTKINDHL